MEELVEEIKNGNKDLYVKVVDLMRNQLYNTALSKLSDEELAKDAVQETFLKAYHKIDQLKDTKYFKTWITKILINECNDINSSRKLEKDTIDKLKDNLKEDAFSFDKAEKAELEKKAWLDDLNEKERDVVSLYYEDGYTTSEISKHLDMNENTVKSFLCRARKKLRVAKLLIVIFAFIIVTSGVALGGRWINSLKEKLVMFQITSTKGISDSENYIEKVNTDFIYSNSVGIKVDSVAMDDNLLYISYLLDIKDEIKDIELEEYVIKDEADNLLAVSIANDINNILTSDYSSGGVSYAINPEKQEGDIWKYSTVFQVAYDKNYPRSHKIYVDINKISILTGNARKSLEGSWKFEIDLPSKFFDRTSETYKYKADDKVKSIKTSLKDLSFELEIEFSDNIDYNVMTSNNLILKNSIGEQVNCYSKLIGRNKVKYICDIGKHSENIDELNVYIKYNKGADKYVDITLKK